MQAPLPENEAERLKTLADYHILDTPQEQEFDDLTLLASQICGTPIALMTLIDDRRQWFKSKIGLGITETHRDLAFCAHAILQPGVFVVPDAMADARFADNPLVTADPHIRFYAGAPLVAPDGNGMGTLCVIDRAPRVLSDDQVRSLNALGRQAVSQLELRRKVAQYRDAQAALRAAKEDAEAANRAKSYFLATMSHELRTPLNAILGYSELLQEQMQRLGLKECESDVSKIHTAGSHLHALINDVLDLSKIEAGKLTLCVERFEAAAVVRECATMVSPLLSKNGNTLDVQCGPGLGVMRSDPLRVRQCLFNLLSNACKFTQRGVVRLTASRDSTDGRDYVTFGVADNGIGMSPEETGRLFQPFSQAHDGTAHQYGGTGLGLAISRRFCRLMGGDISVESKPGVGSTFTIRLPAEVS